MTARACPTPTKTGFPTARAAKKSIVRRGVARGGRLRAYLCECGSWHLAKVFNGFQPASRKRAS